MAYSDINRQRQISPLGLAGALGLTGSMVVALIFAGSTIARQVDHYESVPTITPTAPPIEKEVVQPKKETVPPPELRTLSSPTTQPVRETWTPLKSDPVEPQLITPPPPEKDIVLPPDPTPEPKIALVLPPVPPPIRVTAQVDTRYQNALQPPYPSSKRREEVGGRVTVRVLIGTDGRVKAVEPVSSDDAAFFGATRDQALKKWRFRPATLDGKPVESWKSMSVVFKMEHG
jgi:periplasmic protein TonB